MMESSVCFSEETEFGVEISKGRGTEIIQVPMRLRKEKGGPPIIVFGQWGHSEEEGSEIRLGTPGHFELGAQFVYELYACRARKASVLSSLPGKLECYEQIKSSDVEEEFPISRVHVDWRPSEDNSRRWSVGSFRREWISIEERVRIL